MTFVFQNSMITVITQSRPSLQTYQSPHLSAKFHYSNPTLSSPPKSQSNFCPWCQICSLLASYHTLCSHISKHSLCFIKNNNKKKKPIVVRYILIHVCSCHGETSRISAIDTMLNGPNRIALAHQLVSFLLAAN